MLLLAVFVVIMALWYFLRKLCGKISCLMNAVDMMAVFFTMSLSFLTKISSPSQRLLLSACLLMCVLQSSLLEAFSILYFNPDVDKLQKLDELGLPIVTLDPNLMDTFDESPVTRNPAAKLQHQNLSP
jgi:hypothetical protein